jgi:hypothetical protein
MCGACREHCAATRAPCPCVSCATSFAPVGGQKLLMCRGCARRVDVDKNTVERLPAARQTCKFWIDFWFIFYIIFWYQFSVHPDVTKYAREGDMLLKGGARGGRETKRLEQRSAALTCARGPGVSARWCDRVRLGALSKARRAPRAQRMGAARQGARWRCARWSVDCSEARACGVAADGAASVAYGIAGWPLC